jgi:hypothetical protein
MNNSNLNIITLNVGGLNSIIKKQTFINFIQSAKVDFFLIQETNQSKNIENTSFLPLSNFHIYSTPCNHRGSGNIIGIKKNLSINEIIHIIIDDGYAHVVEFFNNDKLYLIINIYIPHNNIMAKKILENINKYLNEKCYNGNPVVIIGGDFNCTLNQKIDRQGSVEYHFETINALKRVINNHHLTDIFRYKYPTAIEFSRVIIKDQLYTASRIDKFYTSFLLKDSIETITHKYIGISDHKAVCLNLRVNIKCTPHWIFDNNLLKFNKFKLYLSNLIYQWKNQKQDYNNIATWWDGLKKDIQLETQEFKMKHEKYSQTNISNELDYAENRLNLDNTSSYYTNIRQKYERFTKMHSIETIFQKKCIENMNESKQETFFRNLDRNKKRNISIDKLKTNSGLLICDQNTVREYMLHYYSNLFKSDNNEEQNTHEFFEDVPKLNEELKIKLNDEISMDEINNAIREIRLKSAPGYDGLTAEFYKGNAPLLVEDLHILFNQIYNDEIPLPYSWKITALKLIPKTTNDLDKIENWRPISVINTDLKIFSKILSNRLNEILPEIISESQAFSMPERTMQEQIL